MIDQQDIILITSYLGDHPTEDSIKAATERLLALKPDLQDAETIVRRVARLRELDPD